jgi:hypothetical protein
MTSWSSLETYLDRLVKSVAGVGYVLRGSRGRHLAPRLPRINEAALADAFNALQRGKEEGRDSDRLRELLGRVLLLAASVEREAESFRERSRDDTFEGVLREVERVMRLIARFNQHSAVLESAIGGNFVTRGPGKRYIHRAADLPFIAERLLSSYVLVVVFRSVEALDSDGVLLALGRARSTICDMLGDLPPDGGGDRALSNANRIA